MFASSYKVWRPKLWAGAAVAVLLVGPMRAAEHVTLKNGFALDCVRQDAVGDRVRLYLLDSPEAGGEAGETGGYLEVGAADIASVDEIAEPAYIPDASGTASGFSNVMVSPAGVLRPEELRELLTSSGSAHNVDEDLLASVVHAESGGRVRAVSRTGARGLMQLMPETARDLGVKDAFAPKQNIAGGTAYLDQLLTRYHDNIALAVAAYNAGPVAVDRYHGVPPYRETRAYVASVIREFNRRKQMELRGEAPKPVSGTR